MSDVYSVMYSTEAKSDLLEIYVYIAFELGVPNIAKNQINRIRKKIRSLDFMPARYTIVDWEPWRSIGMHRVPVDNFVVYYVINNNNLTVTIIRIFYGGRNIESIINTKHE
ncbi:type II toxin-antitoxin system RelE/ParE family toxin [uncultured Megasphaera sp.]|uniref:type II toxin-antitoxin system RelE/ParE family toxin n=1 Tax=uncultured Megasphaera sp. TaxID=165188 RepID=UPI003450F9BA